MTPGCKFAPLASRSYANKSCPYVPGSDLKFNTRYILCTSNWDAQRVYTVSGDQRAKSPIFAHFEVNVALSQYIAVTLSVDFRCPDS